MMSEIKSALKKNETVVKLVRLFNKLLNDRISKNISGKNNKVLFSPLSGVIKCHITINGNNNEILVEKGVTLNNLKIFIEGNNCLIHLRKNVQFKDGGTLWVEDNHGKISIGDDTVIHHAELAVTENNSKITIGSGCLFAYGIDIRCGDSHSIIDLGNKERINHAKDVVIGNKVWMAAHTTVLKGVTILDNCVVATKAIVTRSPGLSNVILGGIPAKVIKKNISWAHERM
ncbi:acyltransferase [Mucilaginibacter conchicola]|uniref:Acyltransferase n=1 Tax=Mucilaginibacter conchicola TaxID=2303333 RepID=A0A372NXL3_9SPHI|nr:acyltransferase [Mucilaginibacter conchicola]RFZ94850.1 acyltransferase [Mucilaginibacter conchicola]